MLALFPGEEEASSAFINLACIGHSLAFVASLQYCHLLRDGPRHSLVFSTVTPLRYCCCSQACVPNQWLSYCSQLVFSATCILTCAYFVDSLHFNGQSQAMCLAIQVVHLFCSALFCCKHTVCSQTPCIRCCYSFCQQLSSIVYAILPCSMFSLSRDLYEILKLSHVDRVKTLSNFIICGGTVVVLAS